MKIPSLFLILCSLLFSCSGDTPSNFNSSSNSNIPTTTPPPATVEKDQKAEETKAEQNQAIADFIEKNYKGWSQEGTGSHDGGICWEEAPCDLNLIRGRQNTVIAVMLRQFTRANGSKYWFVFKARPIDLTEARIEKIKEEEREDTLENLEKEDCQVFLDDLDEDDCQAVIDNLKENEPDRDDNDDAQGPRGY